MSQSGLRHAATEPDHLDAKRERSRRGAAGRAAALRRAPSDSDCSGETASLSADSADRVRPAVASVRTTKLRSRRRGSEWEVLEGLKDGQRFERRPEVFNGYLHKKRKWPLKGWHKRFFVVDGGILVYARSPTDVARGRLHGSVDVGLSVISAKTRRRRIDIDADEFIYHLRAKTPDVFRTWLNVLKVHRLYRQHLITFGTRESAPKIHVPLDELPPTDTSSQTSYTSTETRSTNSSYDFMQAKRKADLKSFTLFTPYHLASFTKDTVYNWNCQVDNTELMPMSFELLEEIIQPNLKPQEEILNISNRSTCSMNCLENIYRKEIQDLLRNQKSPDSLGASAVEKQLHTAELDRNSLKYNPYIESTVNYNYNTPKYACSPQSIMINTPVTKKDMRNNEKSDSYKETHVKPIFPVLSDLDEGQPKKKKKRIKLNKPGNRLPDVHRPESTAAFFLFAQKKRLRPKSPFSQMKRSKKSTNLVKYRNCSEEPPLSQPLSIPMLLRRCKNTNKMETVYDQDIYKFEPDVFRVQKCTEGKTLQVNNAVQTNVRKEHKALQDSMTALEYEKITEQLILSMLKNQKSQSIIAEDTKYYVNQMIRELYDVKLTQIEAHPVKILFRSLLEYWLKTSCSDNVNKVIKDSKSVVTQSVRFTRDAKLSTVFFPTPSEEKQVQVSTEVVKNKSNFDTKHVTYSFLKERRIQELERLLKNTVYPFESIRSEEKDIQNFESRSFPRNSDTCSTLKSVCSALKKSRQQCSDEIKEQNSSSSAECKRILNAIDQLLSQTSIPPDCIKEILDTYLRVLMDDSGGTTKQRSYNSQDPRTPLCCHFQAEAVQIGTSVDLLTSKKDTTSNKNAETQQKVVNTDPDSGQIYLKDVLDKITAIFTKQIKQSDSNAKEDKHVQPDDTKVEGSFKNLISTIKDDKSLVLDLTKYDLERISMRNDLDLEGSLSITIKLKECSPNVGEPKHKSLNLKFSDETTIVSPLLKNTDYAPNYTTKNYCRPKMDPRISFKNPYIHYDPDVTKQKDLKSLNSVSDLSSKAYKVLYEKGNSNLCPRDETTKCLEGHADKAASYVLRSLKKSRRNSVIKPKKKLRIVTCKQAATSSPMPLETKPKVAGANGFIDKQFILLLLENLTLLSQSVPELYRDMSVFCLKLKKKHDKKSIGLLGNIYKEDISNTTSGQSKSTASSGHSSKSSNEDSIIENQTNTDVIKQKVNQEIRASVERRDAATQIHKIAGDNSKPEATSNILDSELNERKIVTNLPLNQGSNERKNAKTSNEVISSNKGGNERKSVKNLTLNEGGNERKNVKTSSSIEDGNEQKNIKSLTLNKGGYERNNETNLTLNEVSNERKIVETLTSNEGGNEQKNLTNFTSNKSGNERQIAPKFVSSEGGNEKKNMKTLPLNEGGNKRKNIANSDHKATETADPEVFNFKSRLRIIDGTIAALVKSLLENDDSTTNFRFVTDDKHNSKTAQICESASKLKPVESEQNNPQISRTNSDSSNNDRTKNCAVYHVKHCDSSQSKVKKNLNVYDVYSIFASTRFPRALSGSMAGSSGEVCARVSDDLKSIYRCPSDPSFISSIL